MELVCNTCVVRSWREGDARGLPDHANNRKIWLNLRDRFPHPYTQEDAQDFIRRMAESERETNFAIDVDGEAVGGIGVMLHTDVERCSAEIGYWLGEEYWGRGIMTEALSSVAEYSFREFQLTRIYAVPFAGNTGSCRVLEKAGFVLEGVLRRSAIKDGIVVDQYMYSRIV
jgi:[ribosomal protein S5]-alanine N-acetyltransferase